MFRELAYADLTNLQAMTGAETHMRILVADDDADVLQAALLALAPIAERVTTAQSKTEVIGRVESEAFDCILLDMNFLPAARTGTEGLDLLREIRRRDPIAGVVLMTAFGGVALAVEGLKAGGDDFLLKPWRNEALINTVREAVAQARSRRSGSRLDDVERRAIVAALRVHNGNIAHAASTLGISRAALYRRIEKHGL